MDISKAFDRGWREGLLFQYFLNSRFQRVVLNDQLSSWLSIKGGVPQGFTLGPLIFLIYINDPRDNLESLVKLFSDDTSLFPTVRDP